MSLEEFKKLDAATLPIGNLISMISRGNAIYLNHNLKKFDINASQLHLLFEISNQENLNQDKIASRCNIDKGAVARSIKKLEEKGLIVREIDSKNRRQNIVSLTPKGQKTIEESIEILNNWENEVFADYNQKDLELLKKALKDIVVKTIEINERDGENE